MIYFIYYSITNKIVVFVIGERKVDVDNNKIIESGVVKFFLEQNPNIEIPIPKKFYDLIDNYIDFLNDKPKNIRNVDELLTCYDMESFFDDKNYLLYLVRQAYKFWDEFYPLISTFPVRTEEEIYLHTPYQYVPKALINDPEFYEHWLEINKNKAIILNGDEKYSTKITYYDNGNMKELLFDNDQFSYANPKRFEIKKIWYENGNLASKEEAVGNQTKKMRWFENGRLSVEEEFINDNRHGIFREWGDEGQPYLEKEFENGKKQGVWREWYENGQLRYEGRYVDNQAQGPWIGWHYDSQPDQPRYIGGYLNSKEHGLWKKWYRPGDLQFEGEFNNGEKVGFWREWYPGGELEYEGYYVNGKRT